jgi:hypothetical protein
MSSTNGTARAGAADGAQKMVQVAMLAQTIIEKGAAARLVVDYCTVHPSDLGLYADSADGDVGYCA